MKPGPAARSAPMIPPTMFQNAIVRHIVFVVTAATTSNARAAAQRPRGRTTGIGGGGGLARLARSASSPPQSSNRPTVVVDRGAGEARPRAHTLLRAGIHPLHDPPFQQLLHE